MQTKVANLLCRIAKASPQLIVYPTVVGCSDMISQQHLTKSSAEGELISFLLFQRPDKRRFNVDAV